MMEAEQSCMWCGVEKKWGDEGDTLAAGEDLVPWN